MLSPLYFKQNCRKCCSAQSVCILYNHLNDEPIVERDLFNVYPEWEEYIREPQGITLERLKIFVDDLFGVNSRIIYNPTPKNILDENRLKIIYFDRHYSPVLDTEGKFVLIGDSGNHDMKWIEVGLLLDRMDHGDGIRRGLISF